MFGKHPLSNYEGVPIKDLLKDIKKGDNYKNSVQEREEITRKCQEIYQPPGIVRAVESSLKKNSTLLNEIKNAVPSDNIFKRLKVEQRISASHKVFGNLLANTKKSGFSVLKSKPTRQVERDVHTAPDRERIQSLFKELEVKYDKEPANEVNYDWLFQDNLPAEAIDLREFLRKYKGEDESKEFDLETTRKSAFSKFQWASSFIPKGERISSWMLADNDIVP